MWFADMAAACGLKVKGMYTMKEVACVTGVPYQTLQEERMRGRLKGFLPEGRTRGWLFKPEWVDEWIEEGTRQA